MPASLDQYRYLLKKPQIGRLATIDENGFPHVIPLWFVFEDATDEILIMTDRSTRKAQNAMNNRHGALQVGGDQRAPGVDEYTTGVLVQGEFTVEDDPDHAVTARITRHYLPDDKATELLDDWKNDDVVVLRLKIQKVVKVM